MTDFWTAVLNFAQSTTETVGQQLLQDFGHASAEEKADGSLVTRSDKWADATIRDAIATTFPDHGILSEEGTHVFPDQDWCWIIDPIDGTTNFTRGVPLWGISLGLLYRGTPVFGYVSLPPIRQAFHGYWLAGSGLEGPSGAYLNGQPIRTSTDEPSSNHFFSLCARSTLVMREPDFPCKIRMLGVATYNLLTVAAGIALGGIEATPKIWDIAAIWVIVQAAGGVWIPLESQPIFPLRVGESYGKRPYPTLVTARADLIPVFEPHVKFLGRWN